MAFSLALALVPLAAQATQLTESGSTLLYPLVSAWSAAYGKLHPDVQIDAQATGSGTGIAAATDGTAAIGASDAYLSDAQRANGLLNVPLAVSGQHVAYDVPGIAPAIHLKLSAAVLAAIYSGTLTKWNDPRIASLNPGVALPAETIVPIHRSDASGDTFLFTEFLKRSAGGAWSPGSGTRIAWPAVGDAQTAKSNSEMLQLVRAVRDSIGYVGVSYLEQTRQAGVGVAALRNHDGAYVLPDESGLEAAAAAGGAVPADGRLSLIDLAGARTYPIANYAYAIVRAHQSDAGTGAAIRAFLAWVIDPAGGSTQAMLAPVHFAPLPPTARAASESLIAAIK
jgi:phosphate transport system substrate-binding protein